MKKRTLLTLAFTVATAALLAGCAGGGTPSSGDVLAPTGSPKDVKGTVDWWGWTGVDAANPIIAEFNKAYPNIKVNYKFIDYSQYAATLRPGLTSSSGPDVFTLQSGAIAQQFGPLAADLAPLAAQQLGGGWKDKISAGYTTLVVDGALRAIPLGATSAGTLLVNKTMLDHYGVKVPTETTTLDEWKAICAPVLADGKQCIEQGGQDGWQNTDLFQSIADSYAPGLFRKAVDGKAKWTDPDLVSALGSFQDMFTKGFFQEGAIGAAAADVINDFGAQKTAMTLVGTWGANTYLESGITALESGAGVANPTAFTVVLSRFPDVAGRGNEVPLFGDPDGIAVNPKSDDKKAAAAFAAWVGTNKAAQQFLADGLTETPTLKGVTPQPTGLVDPDVQTKSLAELTAAGQSSSERRQIDYPDLVTAINDALQSVATGTSPSAAAATLQATSAGIDRG
jgi:ABC-type glycerol-3-phosphate transport system substrate-binding protein